MESTCAVVAILDVESDIIFLIKKTLTCVIIYRDYKKCGQLIKIKKKKSALVSTTASTKMKESEN